MRHRLGLPALIVWIALTGCGGQAVERNPPSLHGGDVLVLPENRGVVELTSDEPKAKTTAKRPSTVVVYFLRADKTAAISPVPTGVSIRIDSAKGSKTIPMKLAADAADPLGAARFASEPGPYNLREENGEISATIDGQTLAVPFRAR